MARSVSEAAIVLARDAREDRAVVELGGLEIGPREGVRLGIGGAVAQYQELIKARFGLGHKASFGPAMAAGVSDDVWSLEDVAALAN